MKLPSVADQILTHPLNRPENIPPLTGTYENYVFLFVFGFFVVFFLEEGGRVADSRGRIDFFILFFWGVCTVHIYQRFFSLREILFHQFGVDCLNIQRGLRDMWIIFSGV